MGNEVDVGCGEIGLGKLRSLALESDPLAIGREVIVGRTTERWVGALGILDGRNQVLEFPVQAVAILSMSLLQSAGEDCVEGGAEPVVPVAHVDAIVDARGAQRSGSKLFIVCSSIGIRLAIGHETNVARLGLGGLQT